MVGDDHAGRAERDARMRPLEGAGGDRTRLRVIAAAQHHRRFTQAEHSGDRGRHLTEVGTDKNQFGELVAFDQRLLDKLRVVLGDAQRPVVDRERHERRALVGRGTSVELQRQVVHRLENAAVRA